MVERWCVISGNRTPDERRRSRDIQRAIGDILLRQWNPIGVSGEDEAQDEYQACVGSVYRLLASGSTARQIAEHLVRIEREMPGYIDTDPPKLVPVGERLISAYRHWSAMRYVGPAEIHDGRIVTVVSHADQARLEVMIESCEGNRFTIAFANVVSFRAVRPEGTLLFALAETGSAGGRLLFSFLNWDDEDEALLEIEAGHMTVNMLGH